MASLVADYSGDSGESDLDSSSNEDASPSPSSVHSNDNDSSDLMNNQQNIENAPKLPKPNFETATSKNSVFKNPFAEEENAKKAILEKHVKMVPTKDKVQMINGKKICWNYRKGRCRFGHTCTFAHDTDLHNNVSSKQKKGDENSSFQNSVASSQSNNPKEGFTAEEKSSKRKRPGLGNNIVPSKKVLKLYKHQKSTK